MSETLEQHDARMERERNEALDILRGLDCYLHLLAPPLAERIRAIKAKYDRRDDRAMRASLRG